MIVMESYDSQDYSQRAKLPIDEKHCEQLFDELFQKPTDPEVLEVKRPVKTYSKAFKLVRFKETEPNELDDIDDDDDYEAVSDEDEKDESKEKKNNRKRNRRLAYPNVSKDAVLEAFNKAIESQELPNFDEIEKFPLTIVDDPNVKKKKTIKTNNKSTNGRRSKKSASRISNNENVENMILIDVDNQSKIDDSRKSNRKRTLMKKDTNVIAERSLFNLDESCIRSTDKSLNKVSKQKLPFASTPFRKSNKNNKSSIIYNNSSQRVLRSHGKKLFNK